MPDDMARSHDGVSPTSHPNDRRRKGLVRDVSRLSKWQPGCTIRHVARSPLAPDASTKRSGPVLGAPQGD
jgi:hypothetical protein